MQIERGTWVEAHVTRGFGEPVEVSGEVLAIQGEKVLLKDGPTVLQRDVVRMGGRIE